MRIRQWIILLLCLTSADRAALSADAIDVNDPDRTQAFQLYNQHNMPEAADLFEKVVAKHPTDVAAQEAFGVALVSRAETQTDAEKARADRLSARRALLRAKELGDTSDLCRILLVQIPETGEAAQLSTKPEVDASLKAGEAAFAKGAWQEAIAAYTGAWDLDHNWPAALYLGDTYYSMQDMQRAGEWFAKAIELQPDREQAYRYWGDALLAGGKMKEARLKYIEGVVAEPYNAAVVHELFRSEFRLEPISGRHDTLADSFLMQAGIDRQHILEKFRHFGKRQVSSPFGQQKFQLRGDMGRQEIIHRAVSRLG